MMYRKIVLLACCALCLLIPYVSATVVSVIPASTQHIPGEVQSYAVILDSAPDGLSGFNITITVENPAIAEIIGVSYNLSWASMPTNSTVPADTIWCKAVDLTGSSGNLSIILCNVTVRADSPGTTNITIIPERIEDRIGGRYTATTFPAQLAVQNATAPANAFFEIQHFDTAYSNNDSLNNGPHTAFYVGNINLVNTGNTSAPHLTNITVEVAADNITSIIVRGSEETQWNDSYARWTYPPGFTIAPGGIQHNTWLTDITSVTEMPMSISRSVNKSKFNSSGVQYLNLSITFFDNHSSVFNDGYIRTEPHEKVSATLLPGSFSTDAPLTGFWSNTGQLIQFNIDPVNVEIGRPYYFSVLVQVNVSNLTNGESIKYRPACGVRVRPTQINRFGPPGYNATMPPDMVPDRVLNASVSTGVLANWELSSEYSKELMLHEVIVPIPPTTNPIFQIFDFSTTDTSGDSIIHGIQTVYKNRALNIWSENPSDQFAFSDVLCSVTGSNIHNVSPEERVIWNNSYIQWSYPEPEIYDRNNPLNFHWGTNVTVPWDIPITVHRQVNRSIFSGPGYQLLTVNVTYENTTYGGIYSCIGTGFNQDMPFNATIVPGSFATDDALLIRQYQPVNDHHFGFDLNMSRFEAGKSYNFSIVIFVEPKDAHGQQFEYKPRIDTQMGINTGHQEGGATTTATMPAGLLPPYVTSATVSTNVSLNWSYASISSVQAGLNEVFRNVSTGPYLVSGRIYYSGAETHPITVNIFDRMPGPEIPPINSTQLSGPGTYSFPVGNGTYYLNVLMDLNDNYQWDENEPAGFAINQTFRTNFDPVVINGSDKTNVDITLFTTPYRISGTIYYFGNATGPVGIGAFTYPGLPAGNASPYIGKWLESVGPYTLFVPNGTYYLRSSMDINRNFMHDTGEPAGYAINRSATDEPDAIVVNGANVTGIDIILFPQGLPMARFMANITAGTAPLTVYFTDLSSNSPTGWAWYFGDENFTAPWTQQTASAGWSARNQFSSVVKSDGSIVLMGGWDSGNKNDVWRSTDNGTTWTQQTASAEWSARTGQTSVVMPDGSIILMGGWDSGGPKNDVWRSTDNGATWTQQTASAGWSGRHIHSSVVMPDGSIVFMGGDDGHYYRNDVWRSTDNGTTWTQQTASAEWSGRHGLSSVVIPDGSIVLMGGYDRNDVWRSTDNGATWTQQTVSAGWTARCLHSSVVMPDGSIVLMGGYDGSNNKNDVWRSTDNGATWTNITTSGGWTARQGHTSVAMPDGSIVLMGGYDGTHRFNDTWRLMPAGSSAQNPSHTYTTPGTYQVSLQAFNTNGYNSTRKTGYITVTGSSPYGTLILPDISIPSGARKAAPVFIANVTNASWIGFGLTYNPAVIHITNLTANTSLTGATLNYEINNSTGYVNVSLTTTSPITTVTAKGIVNIIVESKGSTGQQCALSTDFAEWTDPEFGASPLSVRQGTVRIEGVRGDFNTNGRVDIGDVTRVAYMAAGLVPYDIQADFNGDGFVDAGDAAKIAWYYVGKINML